MKDVQVLYTENYKTLFWEGGVPPSEERMCERAA